MNKDEARAAMVFHRDVNLKGSSRKWQIRSVNALKETVLMKSNGTFEEVEYEKLEEA
ncbi:hypothetical protein [Limosilactobacillus gastricus]|uniref:hypothetical protein n=1 Tax=Limosilactobacillus gastricus TaxID=227942 RepID=UPI0002DD8F55|nr:hypothetical protein [Limosilactobacillus gastricus]